MAASSNSDCYLCGSHNEPDASFCVRCNGQILRIPGMEHDDSDDVETPVAEEPTHRADDVPETTTKRRRIQRKGSLQDQRLSDALGLSPEVYEEEEYSQDSDPDGLFAETVVTSIPRATQSSEIPLLGTRAGVVPQTAMSDRETGKKTYALLVALLLMTGWLGYDTMIAKDDRPESIAFASTTTLPATTTTTTEKPVRQWQPNEVQGRFNSTFATVHFFNCNGEPEAGKKAGEAITVENAVIVSTHNVLVSTAPPSATAAEIHSRTGQVRLAMIDRTPDGLIVVTSTRPTSRNLDATAAVTDPPVFYVQYDPETNIVTTDTTSNIASVSEISVTGTGDVHSVRVDARTYSAETLSSIDTRYELIPDVETPRTLTACSNADVLQRVVPEGQQVLEDPANSSNQSIPNDADDVGVDGE